MEEDDDDDDDDDDEEFWQTDVLYDSRCSEIRW